MIGLRHFLINVNENQLTDVVTLWRKSKVCRRN